MFKHRPEAKMYNVFTKNDVNYVTFKLEIQQNIEVQLALFLT